MKLFSRKNRSVKNWHARARMIDPKKTKLILTGNEEFKHVPFWVYKEFAQEQPDKEMQKL